MKSLLGASAFVALFAGAALAADPVAPAAPASAALVTCDFFQNQLISTFCAQSVEVGATVSDSEDRRRTLTNFGGAFTYRQTFVSGGGSVAVTPLSWLRLSATTTPRPACASASPAARPTAPAPATRTSQGPG